MSSTNPTSLHVVIDFEPSDHGICGVLQQAESAPRAFHGWLELAGLLDHARPRTLDDAANGADHSGR